MAITTEVVRLKLAGVAALSRTAITVENGPAALGVPVMVKVPLLAPPVMKVKPVGKPVTVGQV